MTTSQSNRDRALSGQGRSRPPGSSPSTGSPPTGPVPLTPAWAQQGVENSREWLRESDNWNVVFAMVALACFGAVIVESVVDGIADDPLFWVVTPLRVIIACGLVLVTVRGGPLVFRNPINLPIAGIVVAATGSVVLAQGSASALRGVVTSVAVFYLTVGLQRILPPRAVSLPYVVLFVFMVVTSWEAIGQTVSGEDTGHCRVPWSPGQDSCDAVGAWHRAVGTFTNPNLLSAFLLAVIPIALFVAAQVREGYMRAAAMACAASGVVALLCTVSRNAAVSVVAAAVVYVVLRSYQPSVVRVGAVVGVSLVVAANVVAWAGLPVPGLGNRADAYQAGIRLFIANPLGLGLDGAGPALQAALPDEVPYKHVHNMWLNWLMETSLLGFVSWVVLPVLVYRYLARQAKAGDVAAPVLAASLTAIMVNNMWDHPSATNRLEYLMWAVLALCVTTTTESTAQMTGRVRGREELVARSAHGAPRTRAITVPGQHGRGHMASASGGVRSDSAGQRVLPGEPAQSVPGEPAQSVPPRRTEQEANTDQATRGMSAVGHLDPVRGKPDPGMATADAAGSFAATPSPTPQEAPTAPVSQVQVAHPTPRGHRAVSQPPTAVPVHTTQPHTAANPVVRPEPADQVRHTPADIGGGTDGTQAVPVVTSHGLDHGEAGGTRDRAGDRPDRWAAQQRGGHPETNLDAGNDPFRPLQASAGYHPDAVFTADGDYQFGETTRTSGGAEAFGSPHDHSRHHGGYQAPDAHYGSESELGPVSPEHRGNRPQHNWGKPHDPAPQDNAANGLPTSLWSTATNMTHNVPDYEPQRYVPTEPGQRGPTQPDGQWGAGPGMAQPYSVEPHFTNATEAAEPGPARASYVDSPVIYPPGAQEVLAEPDGVDGARSAAAPTSRRARRQRRAERDRLGPSGQQ